MDTAHEETKLMHSDKIIALPFAFDKKKKTGVNVNTGNPQEIYFQNACVASISAKHNNPDCDVAFVTNILNNNIPAEYKNVLISNNIKVITIPYDRFLFPDEYNWGLAFYKLCVLSHLVEMEYKYLCYMDCDVWVQHGFEPIWEECKENIMLYDINHGLQVRDYQNLDLAISDFSDKTHHITHYGGEFFAATRTRAATFCNECMEIYKRMISESFHTNNGDEFIISLAANNMRQSIKNAGAYVYRFWTDPQFYLISTCYKYNPVCVLHMPSEKSRGIIKLYDKYIIKGKMPDPEKVWKTCNLCRSGLAIKRKNIKKHIRSRIKKLLKRVYK